MGHHHHHHGHSHSHSHDHDHHFHDNREGNKKGLWIAFFITACIMVLEFVGGLVTNSLALLSDSGHMLSDASSLLLSLVAMMLATKAANPKKTFGYYRFEILAALFNGVTLFVVSGFIIWEAYGRFMNPQEVESGNMMIIAGIGLLANLLSAWSLMRKGDVKNNVNLRSAYLHILGDALGSVGAILAGLLMMFFSWYIADPIISVFVSLLILKSAWGVTAHALHILMEGTPLHIDRDEVKKALEHIEGVVDVHDLHIWSITSGFDSLTCHMRIENGTQSQHILQEAINLMKNQFHIDHTTFQLESPENKHDDLKI